VSWRRRRKDRREEIAAAEGFFFFFFIVASRPLTFFSFPPSFSHPFISLFSFPIPTDFYEEFEDEDDGTGLTGSQVRM